MELLNLERFTNINNLRSFPSNSLLNSSNDSNTSKLPQQQIQLTRRSCVNTKVRWLMFEAIQPTLKTEEELIAAQWILCNCHKQLPYDRNWWSRMERQNGELSMSFPEIKKQIQFLNVTLHSYITQLLSATAAVKKYIDGIDPVTSTLRKRDWNASTSLSEWISGDRGILIRKLANNDPSVRDIRQYLPESLCEDNLKEALHNGGILIYTEQFSPSASSNRIRRMVDLNLKGKEKEIFKSDSLLSTALKSSSTAMQLNLIKPGAADTRMLDITLMDGSILPVRRSRCSLNIPPAFVSDPVVIPKICVYDFSNGLNLYIFYRGHKMAKKHPRAPITQHRSLRYDHLLREQSPGPSPHSTDVFDDVENHEAPNDADNPNVKRRCITKIECIPQMNDLTDGNQNEQLMKILPGVKVPPYIKQHFDVVRKDFHIYTDFPMNPHTKIEIKRRSRSSLFDHQEFGNNIMEPPLLPFNEVKLRDPLCLSHTSTSQHNNHEALNISISPPQTSRRSVEVKTTTSIPVQSLFNADAETTYLFHGTLTIEILQDLTDSPNFEEIQRADSPHAFPKSENLTNCLCRGTPSQCSPSSNEVTKGNLVSEMKKEASTESTTTSTPLLQNDSNLFDQKYYLYQNEDHDSTNNEVIKNEEHLDGTRMSVGVPQNDVRRGNETSPSLMNPELIAHDCEQDICSDGSSQFNSPATSKISPTVITKSPTSPVTVSCKMNGFEILEVPLKFIRARLSDVTILKASNSVTDESSFPA